MIDTRFYRRFRELDAVCVLSRDGVDMEEAKVFNIGAGGALIERCCGDLQEGEKVSCTISFHDGNRFVLDSTVLRIQDRSVAIQFSAPATLVDRILSSTVHA